MAELPEYRKQRAIEPAPIVQGVREAYNATSATSSMIGEIGTQIAQNAANQMATIRGQQAAEKNPGKKLLPAFTEADKHFQQAFEQQAYDGAIYSANNMLQKQYQLIASKPLSGASAGLFEKNVMPALNNILQNTPETLRPKLKLAMMTSYDHTFFKLSKDISKQAMKEIKFNLNQHLDQNLHMIIDNNSDNFKEDAKKITKQSIQAINEAEKAGTLSSRQAQSRRDSFAIAYQSSLEKAEISGMFENEEENAEKKAYQKLHEFKQNPPKSISKGAHQTIVADMENQIHTEVNNKLKDEDDKFLEMQNKDREGKLTPSDIADLGSDMGSANWNKINKLRRVGDKKVQALLMSEVEISKTIRAGRNTENEFTPNEVNNFARVKTADFINKHGRQPNLMEVANIYRVINDSRGNFAHEINRLMEYGDASKAAEAAAVVGYYSSDKQAKFLNKVSSRSRLIAKTYESIRTSNEELSPQEALESARKQTPGSLSEEDQKKRLQLLENTEGPKSVRFADASKEVLQLANDMRDEYFYGFKKGRSFVEDDMLEGGRVPIKLFTEYETETNRLFANNEISLKEAKEEAATLVTKNWGVSNFDGEQAIRKHPIDRKLAQNNISIVQGKNKMVGDLGPILVQQKKMYENNQVPYYFDFAPGELVEDTDKLWDALLLAGKPIYTHKRILANRVQRTLKGGTIVQEGYIVVDSDRKTLLTNDESYPVYWQPKKGGNKIPIYDVNNRGANWRFSPIDEGAR